MSHTKFDINTFELLAHAAAAAAARSLRPRRSVSSFHGRPLPPVCVGFSSEEGKRRFAEALAAGRAKDWENALKIAGRIPAQDRGNARML